MAFETGTNKWLRLPFVAGRLSERLHGETDAALSQCRS